MLGCHCDRGQYRTGIGIFEPTMSSSLSAAIVVLIKYGSWAGSCTVQFIRDIAPDYHQSFLSHLVRNLY